MATRMHYASKKEKTTSYRWGKKKDRSETESMLGKKTDRDLEDIYTNFHSELHTHDPI